MTLSKKQTIIGIFAVLLLLAIAPVASAQTEFDSAAEARAAAEAEREAAQADRAEAAEEREEARAAAVEERAEARAERQETREELQAERADAKEDRRAALSEKRLAQLENRTDFVIARMSAAVERLNQLISRIETRMDTLGGNGVDTSAARSELNTATEFVNAAENGLADIEFVVDEVLSAEAPRTAWQENGKPAFSAIRDNLKAAHAAIKASVAALKDAANGARSEQAAGDAPEPTEDLENDTVVEDEA